MIWMFKLNYSTDKNKHLETIINIGNLIFINPLPYFYSLAKKLNVQLMKNQSFLLWVFAAQFR